MKVVGGIFLGILLSVTGFYIAYIYIKNIDNGSNPILLVLSTLVVGVGVYILLRMGKSDATVGVVKEETDKEILEKGASAATSKSILERNNELSEEWTKTVEHRDRLKVLEIAEGAKEEAEKS